MCVVCCATGDWLCVLCVVQLETGYVCRVLCSWRLAMCVVCCATGDSLWRPTYTIWHAATTL